MRKKSASGVLASLRGSPYDLGRCLFPQTVGGRVRPAYDSPPRHGRLTVSPASANVTLIMLRVADLAAALLDGLFAHPARLFSVTSHRISVVDTGLKMNFSATW
ncbi:MAG: hypothetical protein OJF47_003320 [Nitrospira sp.]|nr:MAG: hypothetical protein OJF47_003320 [Nitrospira sp.]